MAAPLLADVAELADAQVSEACDGDIVEVQVLSSAPSKLSANPNPARRFYYQGSGPILRLENTGRKKVVT